MSLLTDDEIKAAWALVPLGLEADDISAFANLIESALLAKLAVMELPKPAEETWRNNARFFIYTADQLRQAFAQGAASQLSAEPSAYELSATKYANGRELVYTVPDALASYIKVTPLYTRKEAK